MKTVILAGGFGTRLSEETDARPKPMVRVGPQPILWHIMKIYSAQGFRDFVLCLGYKGYAIKEYFANYLLHGSDVTFDLAAGRTEFHRREAEPWRVTAVETGLHTMTGGRIRRVAEHLPPETFFLTYGDGVADVDLPALLRFHRAHGKAATVTAVRPPSRFGTMALDGDGRVEEFSEKPAERGEWINGGFFVLEPSVMEYLGDDRMPFEREPLERLARDGELVAYRHEGFWQCMDTLRQLRQLEELWSSGAAPWKVWT